MTLVAPYLEPVGDPIVGPLGAAHPVDCRTVCPLPSGHQRPEDHRWSIDRDTAPPLNGVTRAVVSVRSRRIDVGHARCPSLSISERFDDALR
jgi:hypothetical protein